MKSITKRYNRRVNIAKISRLRDAQIRSASTDQSGEGSREGQYKGAGLRVTNHYG